MTQTQQGLTVKKREFIFKENPIAGFVFDVNPDNNMVILNSRKAVEDYSYCISHPEIVVDLGVVEKTWKGGLHE